MKCSAWVLDPNGTDAYPCLAEDCQEHRLPPNVKPLPPHPIPTIRREQETKR